MEISIYTDGACRPNPGVGAYGYVILDQEDKLLHEFSTRVEDTTNNIMELSAVLAALNYSYVTYQPTVVHLYTDSQYVKLGITEWIKGWKKRGWKTAENKMVKNQDLWFLLDEVIQHIHVQFHWVRGHHTSKWNNYIDELCGKHY
jgi:ribonuclease HI